MKRRTYLATAAGVAAALAGCTGQPAGSDGTNPGETTTTDEPTDETSDGGEETTDDPSGDEDVIERNDSGFPDAITDVQTDRPPIEDVTIDVTVPANFSTDHPATLKVAFTNEADESRTFQFGSLVPWDGLSGTARDGSARLLLAPSDGVVPDEPSDGCWRATDGLVLPAVMRSETLEAGETVSQEFRVLAAHDSDACHPPGTYRFGSQNYLEGGWGFDVTIDRVDGDGES